MPTIALAPGFSCGHPACPGGSSHALLTRFSANLAERQFVLLRMRRSKLMWPPERLRVRTLQLS